MAKIANSISSILNNPQMHIKNDLNIEFRPSQFMYHNRWYHFCRAHTLVYASKKEPVDSSDNVRSSYSHNASKVSQYAEQQSLTFLPLRVLSVSLTLL